MHFKLCYVRGDWAYFTTQELSKQWGDDWNDAPYEHNAGEPYTFGDYEKEKGKESWDILLVGFKHDHLKPLLTPSDLATRGNSGFSVELINAGCTPWLFCKELKKSVFAGATVSEFCHFVMLCGGKVYLESK